MCRAGSKVDRCPGPIDRIERIRHIAGAVLAVHALHGKICHIRVVRLIRILDPAGRERLGTILLGTRAAVALARECLAGTARRKEEGNRDNRDDGIMRAS